MKHQVQPARGSWAGVGFKPWWPRLLWTCSSASPPPLGPTPSSLKVTPQSNLRLTPTLLSSSEPGLGAEESRPSPEKRRPPLLRVSAAPSEHRRLLAAGTGHSCKLNVIAETGLAFESDEPIQLLRCRAQDFPGHRATTLQPASSGAGAPALYVLSGAGLCEPHMGADCPEVRRHPSLLAMAPTPNLFAWAVRWFRNQTRAFLTSPAR